MRHNGRDDGIRDITSLVNANEAPRVTRKHAQAVFVIQAEVTSTACFRDPAKMEG